MAETKKPVSKKTMRALLTIEAGVEGEPLQVSCFEVAVQVFKIKSEGLFDGFKKTEKRTLHLGGEVKDKLNLQGMLSEVTAVEERYR